MARTFVSPGVFVNEIDASFLPQAIASIGGAFIGLAEKGPAFVPVRVSNFNEFAQYFGDLNEDYMLSYMSKAYLKNTGTANIVRVLGPSGRTANGQSVTPGYTAQSVWGITAGSGSVGAVMALLELTASAALVVNDLTGDQLDVRITGSSLAGTDGYVISATASFNTGSANYIKNILNTDPTQFATKGYFVKEVYDYALKQFAAGNAKFSSASYAITDHTFGFNSGSTPWIKSQTFGGSTEYNLLRFHTLGHGVAENGRFKVNILNIKASANPEVSQYGKFDVEVREFESDKLVESFPGLDLDPTSINYVLLRLGDQFWTYNQSLEKMEVNGTYPNQSKFIRAELTTGSFPQSALPWGFRGFAKSDLMVISGSGAGDRGVNSSVNGMIDIPLVKDLLDKSTQSDYQVGNLWGVEYVLSGSVKARLTKLPSLTGSDADFSLKNVSGSSLSTFTYNASNPVASQKQPADSNSHTGLSPDYAKFSLPFAFGWDGFDVRKSNPLDNDVELATVTQIGTQALRQAVDIVGDPDFIDINLLAIPGIYSSKVVDYAITAIENRADAFYVIDISGSNVDTVVSNVKNRGFDTNYAAVYYSDIYVKDTKNNKVVRVPASLPAVAAISHNDRVAYEWYAPAGFDRAGLNIDVVGFNVVQAVDRLKASERDKLYENRINPIASFPGQGMVIWGQKTLQSKASALDRINVRRLMLKARKLIASVAKMLVFEPNNPTTWTRFKQQVNPILEDIQRKNGLERFRVVMDDSVNTPDLVDRNIMKGVIQLVPTRAAEFISLDFVISPSGVTFED